MDKRKRKWKGYCWRIALSEGFVCVFFELSLLNDSAVSLRKSWSLYGRALPRFFFLLLKKKPKRLAQGP